MIKVSRGMLRKLSHPDVIDFAMTDLEISCDFDQDFAYNSPKDAHKGGRSRPLQIPAPVHRVRSADALCSAPALSYSHQMSAALAFNHGMPLSRRSASYPNGSDGFLFRTKKGDEFCAYLQWPDRDEESFERGVESLAELEFDASAFSEDDLMHLVLEVFVRLRLDKRLDIPKTKLRRFIMCVRHHMLENPYHNFTHVSDVVQVRRKHSTCCVYALVCLRLFARCLMSPICFVFPLFSHDSLLCSPCTLSAPSADCSIVFRTWRSSLFSQQHSATTLSTPGWPISL
mmetsp:Transcript_110571/g.165527  ORF Transcript_110571/g.165527 Transcript_110571/m.165527 type:complete len:286 (-) Transcript_110571:837-1694(-)